MKKEYWDVTDRQSFIQLLEMLRQDFTSNPEGWENNTLDKFLEAMHAYATDIQGFYDNTQQPINADEPSWQVFADILRGAVVYE